MDISMRALRHRLYLEGHFGYKAPRWIRRLVARTQLHRAWLYGYNGCFSEADGTRYGPARPCPGWLRRIR